MSTAKRHSKFKNVFATAFKKDKCYDGIKVSKSPFESNKSDVNGKFLAVILESQGGGSFLVLLLSQIGRVDINAPKVCGHEGVVLDLAFNPFDDNVIASSSEDCKVMLWRIPDEGLTTNMSEPIITLEAHTRKVGVIAWHPTAANVLASGSFDNNVIVWNTATGEQLINVGELNGDTIHGDGILSLSWNYDGSMLATSSKDKNVRTFNIRGARLISEAVCHNSTKSTRVAFCGSLNYVFTTGFNRSNERQYGLFPHNDLGKPLTLANIDTNSGANLIFFDESTKMVYLAGKGSSPINLFEVFDEEPYVQWLNTQLTPTKAQIAVCSMPKRHLNHSECEVARLYKLHNSANLIEPISMTVPRKSTIFQEDIFPPCYAGIPALTAEEWMSGINKPPVLIEITKSGLGKVVGGSAMTTPLVSAPAPTAARLSKQSSHSSTASSGARERTPSPPLVIEAVVQGQNDEEVKSLRSRVQELMAENQRLKKELAAKDNKLNKIKELL